VAPSPLPKPIPFVDLRAQRQRLGRRIDDAIAAVLAHGQFIDGEEVARLERDLEKFSGARHAVACANGTDALVLALRAGSVGAGDAVLVPAFTFAATAEAVALVGATLVFVDVLPDTFNIDPDHLNATLECAASGGARPKAIIAVDLFGQPADYDSLRAIARRHELMLIADAAQSFGATWRSIRTGTLVDVTTTSFFPAKPLGCYGDGGAIFCDDDETARVLRSLRSHGQGGRRYEHIAVGLNSRLDTLQAAILIEKLAIFQDELDARNVIAERYSAGLTGIAARTPILRPEATSSWSQYTLISADRDAAVETIRKSGVPIAIHYPIALNDQAAYRGYPSGPGGTPVAAELARGVFSLPMHPYLDNDTQDSIIAVVREALSR
jgi:dTDP-4-amino-4,6-dideoxygalactose transaminase